MIDPSKLRSPFFSTRLRLVSPISRSFNASVSVWLSVGCTKGALFGKYCTETVFISGVTEAPEKVTVQPTAASNSAAIIRCENRVVSEIVTKDLVFYIVLLDFSIQGAF